MPAPIMVGYHHYRTVHHSHMGALKLVEMAIQSALQNRLREFNVSLDWVIENQDITRCGDEFRRGISIVRGMKLTIQAV